MQELIPMDKYGISLPDKQLACAPVRSPEGEQYLSAMAAASDFGLFIILRICVAMAGMPVNPSTLVAGFLIFRFFDIVKPVPVRNFERRFAGGPGIVLDDIVAGLLSAVVLRMLF